MVWCNPKDFNSNANSPPIEVFQHNWFREGYFKGSVTVEHGRHEWKFGIESDNTFLHENFSYIITDPTRFPPDTPPTFVFPVPAQPNAGRRPDLEQSAFVQDLIRLGNWTISAGLRWDHYQVLLNQNAVSPRVAISRFFPTLNLNIHGAYDRIFQTPSNQNILLSSSPEAEALDTSVPAVQLPV